MSVVIDSSAVLDLLLNPADIDVSKIENEVLSAPQLLPFEVSNVIRRQWAGGLLSKEDAEQALSDFRALHIELSDWATIADRVWSLRGQLSSYDASYVALAIQTGRVLITADAKLVKAVGQEVQIELIE
jgi:predicted nucleic acid-binding protein